MSTIETKKDWLFPSHEAIYEGLYRRLGTGHFVNRFHVPLREGNIILEAAARTKPDTHTARVALDIGPNDAAVKIDQFIEDASGTAELIGGIVLGIEYDNPVQIKSPDEEPQAGFKLRLSKGNPYEAWAVSGSGAEQKIEDPHYLAAHSLMQVCGLQLYIHLQANGEL